MTTGIGELSDGMREELARRFRFHATNVYRGASAGNSSPLYEQLAQGIAEEPELLRLLVGLDPHQQFANLLLGAVHYLLLEGPKHPLGDFYHSLTPSPRPAQEAYPYFHAFCHENSQQIRRLVTTRSVQTNDVGRCSSLLPAFGIIARRTHEQPFALVELGASAGLNLLWDVYRYDYGTAGCIGDPSSPVHICCGSRGDYLPPLPTSMPSMHHRVGIDLAPIDLFDTTATRWLRALIWPEQVERARLLEAAIGVARHALPSLVPGDLADVLPSVLGDVPSDALLCIFHSYTLNHCPRQTRERLEEVLTTTSRDRDIYRISLEYHAAHEHPRLVLFTYHQGTVHDEHLAFCESYGRWIEWLQRW